MNQPKSSRYSDRAAALVCHTHAFRFHNDAVERKLGRFVCASATLHALPSKDESMVEAERAARRASRRMSVLLGCK